MLASGSNIRPGKTRVGPRPTEDQASGMVIPADAQGYMDWVRMDGNMTCRQVAVLLAVRANPGVSTGAVAALLGIAQPVVTRAADKLASLNFLHRQLHPTDYRLVKLMPGPMPKTRGR